MTDILITHSFFLRFDPKQQRAMMPYPPLGALYAASVLEKHGFGVALFDTMLAASEDELRHHCEKHHPAVVAIYDDDFNYLNKMCLGRMRQAAFSMATIAKAYGAYVVVHGSDATDHAEEYLTHAADAVIVGEGEETLSEICQMIIRSGSFPAGSVPGVAYRSGSSVLRSRPRPAVKILDQLPLPAWHLVDGAAYKRAWVRRHGYFSLNMVTTRGCPYHCNWCAKPIYGQVYNARTPENVVEEIELLKRTLDPGHLWFADDIFGLKPGWVEQFAVLMDKKKIEVKYKIQSRADLLLQGNTIDALAQSGCVEVWIGAESGSQKILDAMEKGITVSQIYEARRRLKKAGIRAAFFLQFGYPGENQSDIAATIGMVKDLMPDDLGISVSYPLPGTTFYENVKAEMIEKKNWIDSNDLALMFRGTYSADYYRRLHRYVHRLYRCWKGLQEIAGIVRLRASINRAKARSMLSVGYFAPAALFDRLALFYYARQ